MTNQIYHIVYLTTNLTNNKIYVGIHSTKILDDKYLGSGKIIKKALLKYGAENFKKDILYFCLSIKDALEIEKQIVDNNFIKRKDTYNLVIGGAGGSLATYNSNKKGKKIEEILGSERGG